MTDRPRLLEPSRLEPVPVDLRRVILVGTGLWALALVVALALGAAGTWPWTVAWVCVAGIGLGAAALIWVRHNPHRTS